MEGGHQEHPEANEVRERCGVDCESGKEFDEFRFKQTPMTTQWMRRRKARGMTNYRHVSTKW